MPNYNLVVLIGHLTRDAELKYTTNGKQVAKFGIAVNRTYGEKQTDFFNVTAWGKLAEICGQYLKKGNPVLIEGSIQTRSWETNEGQKRTGFEINASKMQMLGGKGGGALDRQSGEKISPQEIDEFDAEDMPF